MRRSLPCTQTTLRAAFPATSATKTRPKWPELWRKRVRVEGLLRRDSSSGLPQSIRDVTDIQVLEPPATEPEDLWGILPTVDAVPALRECLARGFP